MCDHFVSSGVDEIKRSQEKKKNSKSYKNRDFSVPPLTAFIKLVF